MKRLLTLFAICTTLLVACTAQPIAQGEIEQEASSPTLKAIDRKADKMLKKVLNSKSGVKPAGAIYYVAADGDDANDGLSPRTPIRTLDKVNALDLHPSDGVMFRRGDVWRGNLSTKAGVTYSAYGRGEKPRIWGSPYDAAVEGEWIATSTPNIYMYSRDLPKDVGTLVFNHGEAVARKIIQRIHPDGSTTNYYTGEPFENGLDLNVDLNFFHDYEGEQRLYLYSAKGNPSERFSSIELLVHGNVIDATDNVHIDNLCVMYGGSHGIGSSTTQGLTVTNCVVGWIGGSILTPAPKTGGRPSRYGNGVEIYGGCGKFIVDNCYIYQVYDAGITNQNQENISDTSRSMHNVSFTNNLIERCEMSIEYYLGAQHKTTEGYMENIRYEGNILRLAGFGWGSQRGASWAAHLKSWWMHYNQAYNFVIRNNIFDRSKANLINVVAGKAEWLPQMDGNTYIHYLDAEGARIGQPWSDYAFDKEFPAAIEKILGEKDIPITYIQK